MGSFDSGPGRRPEISEAGVVVGPWAKVDKGRKKWAVSRATDRDLHHTDVVVVHANADTWRTFECAAIAKSFKTQERSERLLLIDANVNIKTHF